MIPWNLPLIFIGRRNENIFYCMFKFSYGCIFLNNNICSKMINHKLIQIKITAKDRFRWLFRNSEKLDSNIIDNPSNGCSCIFFFICLILKPTMIGSGFQKCGISYWSHHQQPESSSGHTKFSNMQLHDRKERQYTGIFRTILFKYKKVLALPT